MVIQIDEIYKQIRLQGDILLINLSIVKYLRMSSESLRMGEMSSQKISSFVLVETQAISQMKKQSAKLGRMDKYLDFDPNCYMKKQQFDRRYFRLRQMLNYRGQLEYKKQKEQIQEVRLRKRAILEEKKSIYQNRNLVERVDQYLTSELNTKDKPIKMGASCRAKIEVPKEYIDESITEDQILTYDEAMRGLEQMCKVKPDETVYTNDIPLLEQNVTASDLLDLEKGTLIFFRQVMIREARNAKNMEQFLESELALVGTKFEAVDFKSKVHEPSPILNSQNSKIKLKTD